MADFEEIIVRLADGYEAYARFWNPPSPRGSVLYHHGIQSHCGWYETSPSRLFDAGFAVLQIDRRGTGRNVKNRGHAESAEQLMGDAKSARDELLRRTGHDGYHVVGVSWGGKLTVAAYVDDGVGALSLSLVTPGLFPLAGVSAEEKAKIGFAMLYEQRQLFDIPLNNADLFTSAPRWKKFFQVDGLTLRQCTAGFYLASRRMDKICARLEMAPPVPIHLFVAGEERIVDNEKTESFIGNLGWNGGRITRYEQAKHSLEFESDPEAYFRDLVSFIQEAT